MRLFIAFVLGVLFTCAAIAAVGYFAVSTGAIEWRADIDPGTLETWAARKSLHASLDREGAAQSPIADDEPNIMAGARLYMQNCAFCHGSPQYSEPRAGQALYQPAPNFTVSDVTDDPTGKIHAVIAHGIRLTGMPAYDKVLKDNEVWQLAQFLKRANDLPPAVDKYWQNAKPAY